MGLSFFENVANQASSLLGFNVFKEGDPISKLSMASVVDSLTDRNDIYKDAASPNANWKKDAGYGFGIFKSPNLGLADATMRLQINPESLQQDEEFSIQFFPTPKGIVVEHQGSIMKDIVISGVTGNHPKRSAGGVDMKGDIIFGTGDSGYKQFHDLRNFIRGYAEIKKNPENKDYRLVFFNFRDNETFYVEPTRFSLKRDKARPYMYEYNITMKTIGRGNDLAFAVDDRNIFEKIYGGTMAVLDRVSNTINVSRGIINGSINFLVTVDREVRRKVLDPLNQLELAINDFKAGKNTVLGLPRKFLKDLNKQIDELNNKTGDKVGVKMQQFSAYVGRITSSNTAATGREPTYNERQLIKAMNDSNKAINTLLANKGIFMTDADSAMANIEAVYAASGVVIPRSNSAKNVQIEDGDTIQDIAAKFTDDASNFMEIVTLNNLKYPYIAAVKSDGVLSYNDKILIPSNINANKKIQGVFRNVDWEITRKLPESEKDLGVDIKVNQDKDLVVTNTHDFDLVSSRENVLQSVGTMLGVEQGGLKLHTKYGVELNIGEKNIFGATLIRQQIEKQLSQDSRIDPSSQVFSRVEGNKIFITLYLKIKNVGQLPPLQLAGNIA